MEVDYFFKFSADQKLVFKWSQAQVFFLIHMKYVVFICCTIKILISNWPRTRKFSQLLQTGKTVAFDFSYHGQALVTLYVQFLCSYWSKFDRWVHAENLCSIFKLVYFDSWSWQSFVSTCDVLTVFFHWMYKMKYSCYQESSVIHGWFVYWIFGCEMRRLSKSEIRFRMASFLFFTLLDA